MIADAVKDFMQLCGLKARLEPRDAEAVRFDTVSEPTRCAAGYLIGVPMVALEVQLRTAKEVFEKDTL